MTEQTDTVLAVPAPSRLPSWLHETVETVRTVAVAVLAAAAFQTVLFQPFTIPSASMEPGLRTGDYVLVSKFAYGWSRASLPFNPPVFEGRVLGAPPHRGDVVVFRHPRDPQKTWVKRVIGVAGDRVQVRGGVVFVNGRALERTVLNRVADDADPAGSVLRVRETNGDGRAYLTHDGGPGRPGDDTDPRVVPQGMLFVLGDNRDNSLDGRWPSDQGVGWLPVENVVGRAEVVVASWKPGAGLFKPWTWLNLQPGRFLVRVR